MATNFLLNSKGKRHFVSFNEVSALMPNYLIIKHESVSKKLLRERIRKKFQKEKQGDIGFSDDIAKKYEDALKKERITSELLSSAKYRNTNKMRFKLMKQAIFFPNAKLRLLKTINIGTNSYSILDIEFYRRTKIRQSSKFSHRR